MTSPLSQANHWNSPASRRGEGDRDRYAVARVAIGTAVIAGEQLRGGVRAASQRTADLISGLVGRAKDESGRRAEHAKSAVRDAIDQADRRGRDTIANRRRGASSLIGSTMSGAIGWAQENVVPKLAADVVPRLIDGALPEIRARVIPAFIDDLTNDPRMRDLMAGNHAGAAPLTDHLRNGSARADDRLAPAHRVAARNEKGGISTNGPSPKKSSS